VGVILIFAFALLALTLTRSSKVLRRPAHPRQEVRELEARRRQVRVRRITREARPAGCAEPVALALALVFALLELKHGRGA
jgi:hypothetical protein